MHCDGIYNNNCHDVGSFTWYWGYTAVYLLALFVLAPLYLLHVRRMDDRLPRDLKVMGCCTIFTVFGLTFLFSLLGFACAVCMTQGRVTAAHARMQSMRRNNTRVQRIPAQSASHATYIVYVQPGNGQPAQQVRMSPEEFQRWQQQQQQQQHGGAQEPVEAIPVDGTSGVPVAQAEPVNYNKNLSVV
mmetsp:Transcript_10489/g.33549  ORF Transcript_10489/g.33549 Transcript_10489/m.33549 type:complete len:187 (+) Transcript_10489:71-631(+)